MSDFRIVHKALFWDKHEHTTIALVKFVDREDMTNIRMFMGAFVDAEPDNIPLLDLEPLLMDGIEISKGALDIFLNKEDYDEMDLLGDDDKSLAIALS